VHRDQAINCIDVLYRGNRKRATDKARRARLAQTTKELPPSHKREFKNSYVVLGVLC
jgi:hypothetical protein